MRPKIAVKKSTSTYTQVTKNIVQVLIIFFYFHMLTIFVLSGSVAKLSSSAISGKTKIYLSLINKIKFERVCLFKMCQNPVTTANHVWKTFILVIQSKNHSLTMYISCFLKKTSADVSRLESNSNVSLIWPLGHGRFFVHIGFETKRKHFQLLNVGVSGFK